MFPSLVLFVTNDLSFEGRRIGRAGKEVGQRPEYFVYKLNIQKE